MFALFLHVLAHTHWQGKDFFEALGVGVRGQDDVLGAIIPMLRMFPELDAAFSASSRSYHVSGPENHEIAHPRQLHFLEAPSVTRVECDRGVSNGIDFKRYCERHTVMLSAPTCRAEAYERPTNHHPHADFSLCVARLCRFELCGPTC